MQRPCNRWHDVAVHRSRVVSRPLADDRVTRSTSRRRSTHRSTPPALFLLGLAVLAAGAVIDAGHHTGLLLVANTGIADAGHLITLLGMLLTLVGVVQAGVRARR